MFISAMPSSAAPRRTSSVRSRSSDETGSKARLMAHPCVGLAASYSIAAVPARVGGWSVVGGWWLVVSGCGGYQEVMTSDGRSPRLAMKRFASAAIVVTSSAGSIGLARWMWNPARSALHAVVGSRVGGQRRGRQLAHARIAMPPDAIDELVPVDERHPEVRDDDVGHFGVERGQRLLAPTRRCVTRAPAASSTSATSASASRSSSTAST